MTLDQLLGQMMMIGWQTPDAQDVIEDIARYHFGNVILYSRNIGSASQLQDLCGKIQEACVRNNGAPALIAIDQEGGGACRIFEGVTPVPGAMAQAAASGRIRNAAGLAGQIVGSELKGLGINFDLAPVADVNTNPYNPVIGARAYSDNPAMVGQLAGEFAQGLQQEGVLACYKHFLGHGDVDVDSRYDLPRVRKTLSELELCELVPYKTTVEAEAIMAGHVLYTELDGEYPASLSHKIITKLLRERLRYEGLILSDCFEMGGLERAFSLGGAAVFAVNAGIDLIPVSHHLGRQLAVRSALLDAVKSGAVSKNRILEANRRISAAKARFCGARKAEPDFEKNRRTAERIGEAAVTLLSGRPFEIDANTVAIGVAGYAAVGVTGRVDPLSERRYPDNPDVARAIGQAFRIPSRTIDNKNFNIGDLTEFARGRKVVLCLSDSHLTLIQRALYEQLRQANCRILLVSMRTPYDVLHCEPPECHLATFEYTESAIEALIRVLRGKDAYGVCPVRLHRKIGSEKSDETRNYLVGSIVTYIRNNYAKHLTLDSVAEEFYISGGHLCKLLKKKLNKNFIDMVNEVRVEEAKRLLLASGQRVYEIASRCGFSDINYFSKTFKKYTGMTPSAFRNQQRKL